MTEKIKEIISQITLEEKALLLSGASNMSTASIERLGIKGIEMADGPHGVRFEGNSDTNATSFPCLSAVAASWNRDIAFKMGEGIAKDCIHHEKDLILGPAINIKRIDLCGRNFEYFSEDPVLSGEMAAAYINGAEGLGVGTSVKHYAVNNQEVDRLFVSAEIDERTMREIYLKAFEIAVEKSKPASFMCAVNKVNGVLCSENKFLLNDILKEEWGYEGFIMSDWGCSKDAGKSVQAGLDLQMPQKADIVEQIKTALEKGTVTMEKIDDSVGRILNFSLKHKFADINYDRDAQHDTAREISEESIVLLKNKDNMLPLTSKKYKKIVVIGEFADKPVISGYGSSNVFPQTSYIDSPLENIRKLLPDTQIEYIPLYYTDKQLERSYFYYLRELTPVDDADAVIMFAGRQKSVETEGTDRVSSHLDSLYEFFIKRIYPRNKNIIMVMQAGGAVIPVTWQDKIKAIVQMWYGGEAAGSAIANVLCGKVNPSGKLSETFPMKTRTDIDYPGDGYKVCYNEKWEVGYRYYDTHPYEVWFPFGHGLSYTTFEYSNLNITPVDGGFKASLNVTNTGDVAGKEVVQLYVSDRVSTVSKPEKELKDFAKISLEKGETKKVEFDITDEQLSYYNTSLKQWVTEPGVYDIIIGASCQDIRLCGEYVYDKECPYTLNYEAEQIMG